MVHLLMLETKLSLGTALCLSILGPENFLCDYRRTNGSEDNIVRSKMQVKNMKR